MHNATSPTYPSIPRPQYVGSATVAIIACVLGGTGSVFAIDNVSEWGPMLRSRVPNFCVQEVGSETVRPDIRSAIEHLANIRQVLNPAIADLAITFGVSRQAIYKWIGGESKPEPEKFKYIRSLSLVADAFQQAGVTRAAALLKLKAFDGRSLMDLLSTDQLLPEHTQLLIAEAQAMDTAYNRSGLAKSKAAPSNDWRTEISIPGSSEDISEDK